MKQFFSPHQQERRDKGEAEILLSDVSKRFSAKKIGEITAVDRLSLDIRSGECFAFLGPSGCGKTTTLRMIAGFEDLSEGEIHLSGRLVSSSSRRKYIPPEERGLGMVFQAFAVWPHMNVFDNVAFPLKVQKRPAAEIRERVLKALRHSSLDGAEKAYPSELSGGQQQRIALARAIVTNPRVMLLDEPLSNLDPHLRESMRFEIKALQKEFGFTIIFVTHDQSEAMALSDRMMVMDMGRKVQIGTPEELYNRPNSRFVHSFLGESSFIPVRVEEGKAYVKGYAKALPLDVPSDAGERMVLATRPNSLELRRRDDAGDHADTFCEVKILQRRYLPDFIEYFIELGEEKLKLQCPHRLRFEEGEHALLRFAALRWYPEEDSSLEKERLRRQLI